MHGSTGAEAEAEAEARGCLGGWVRPRQRETGVMCHGQDALGVR